MEMLLPIGMLLFILIICLRFMLGEKIFEHVASKFAYDIIKGILKLPIQIFAMVFKMMKFK